MTPTATKTNINDELVKLDRERERTYAELQEAKRTQEAFEAETEQRRAEYGQYLRAHPEEHRDAAQNPKADTKAAALQDEIRGRMAENPHTDDFESAKQAFDEADGAVEAFRREHVEELVDEARAGADEIIAHLRGAFEQLVEGSLEYRGLSNSVKSVISATPGLGGLPHLDAYDGRVEEWARLARAVLDSEILRPGLSDAARVRLDRLG